jgi:hypothetical protein
MSEDDIRLWPDGSPVTPWADPWHDVGADLREAALRAETPEDTAAVLWMLDLDEDGWPVLAHRITEELPGGDRVTACGRHAGLRTHRGWWMTPPGELPLQAHAVHCGKPEDG